MVTEKLIKWMFIEVIGVMYKKIKEIK